MTQVEKAQRIINNHRRTRGLGTLRRAQDLIDVAMAHAKDMAARGYFDHDDPDGRGFDERWPSHAYVSAGEVLYYTSWTPDSHIPAVRAWMNSPGHYAQIMNGKYNRIGLARFYDEPQGLIYWVGVVGRAK